MNILDHEKIKHRMGVDFMAKAVVDPTYRMVYDTLMRGGDVYQLIANITKVAVDTQKELFDLRMYMIENNLPIPPIAKDTKPE